MSYTYTIEETGNSIVVFIELDGNVILSQPHHPDAANFAPWESVEEANEWAKSKVEFFATPREIKHPVVLEESTND
jgi:hypothetical protein